MKNKMIGIPYMGSKRQIAPKIVHYIMQKNPNCKHFYDLFGGGGAVSFQALQHKNIANVYYNEIDAAIVELIRKIQTDGITKEFYKWIDRDTFDQHKNGTDWFAGFVKTCYSFGNNKKDYLFGKHIEEQKRLMHEIVVNRCTDSLDKLNQTLSNIPDSILSLNTITKRRLALKKYVRERIDFQPLERLQQLLQLQQLERLQQLEMLHLHHLDYRDVPINTPIEETIIYCDIPYQNTKEYQHKFDHTAFEEWVANSPYKIYVSSYEFPLPCVLEIKHRSTLSATANNKTTTEKLFCNQPENLHNSQNSLFYETL